MILGLLCMIVANAAVLLGTQAILTSLRVAEPCLRIVAFLLLRLLLISLAVLTLGFCGFLHPVVIGALGVVALIVLLANGWHRRIRLPRLPDVHPVLGVFLALVLARLLAQAWFFAPYPGDALSYHLPKVAEWVRAQGFTREMGLDTHVAFPAGFELIEMWWVVFLRHDVVIELAGIEFLFLGFVSVYATARRLDLNENLSAFAAVVYCLTPGLYFQATACVNDAPVAALYVATIALAVGNASWATWLLPIGLGIGIKATYAYACGGIVLLGFLSRREQRPYSTRVDWLLSGLSLAVGFSWWVRNLVWFGNPIHPVGTRGLAGANPIQFGPKTDSLFGNVGDLVENRLYDAATAYGPYVSDISGWGAAVFSCGLLALTVALREDPRIRRLGAAFFVSLIVTLALVIRDPWSMRFVLFFSALPAIAMAHLGSTSRTIFFAGSLGVALTFVGTLLPKELPRDVFHEVARQDWRDRSLAKLLQVDVSSDSIGYYVDSRNIAYLLYRPDFSRRVVYLRAKTADEFLRQVQKEQLRLVYAAPSKPEQYELLKECVARGRLRKLQGFIYAVE